MSERNGAMVVELLTRAHRLGFVLEYRPRHPDPHSRIGIKASPPVMTAELRQLERDIFDSHEILMEIWGRPCTIRGCDRPNWLREHGTDLAWCRGHGGTRGWQLLTEEHPDLFAGELVHACPTWITRTEENAA